MPRKKSWLPVESCLEAGAATIRDVARRADVSVATVSRVMNASAPVREPTRQRIIEAARELHFTPNASARSLSMRRTTALGVVLPDLHGEFFSELLRGIDRTAQQHQRHLLVSSSHHDPEGIAPALRAMHGRVDGLIVMAPDLPASALAGALPHGIPTVMLNCAAGATGADSQRERVEALVVDNFGGAVTMVRHLASVGHRRIAFIAGAAHNEDARERRRGYVTAMRELGLGAPLAYQPRGDFTEEGGSRATLLLLTQQPAPTAIFAANDMMALGALLVLRDHGVRVPQDMAVVGFDNIPAARYVTPPLTTVAVDADALGARAATLLLANMGRQERGKSGKGSVRSVATSGVQPKVQGEVQEEVRGEQRPGTGRTVPEVVSTLLMVRESCGSAPGQSAPGQSGAVPGVRQAGISQGVRLGAARDHPQHSPQTETVFVPHPAGSREVSTQAHLPPGSQNGTAAILEKMS